MASSARASVLTRRSDWRVALSLSRVIMRLEEPRLTPTTRYARSGNVSTGYQVLGDRPADLVMVLPAAC